jgi:hypothetical protein
LYSYGLIPSQGASFTKKDPVSQYGYCDLAQNDDNVNSCSDSLDSDQLNQDFNTFCVGNKACEFDITSYVNLNSSNTACTSQISRVYMQYFCLQDSDVIA